MPSPARLILEGVAGSGKTQILNLLRRDPRFQELLGAGRVYTEEETFGDLMEDLKDLSKTDISQCARLRRVMQSLSAGYKEHGESLGFLLERFHASYYVFLPRWRLYDYMDQSLANLGCRMVLLTYPAEQTAERSLNPDLIEYYGSSERAIEALVKSQERRLDFLKMTRLPSLVIDTGKMDWPAYAERILVFCK